MSITLGLQDEMNIDAMLSSDSDFIVIDVACHIVSLDSRQKGASSRDVPVRMWRCSKPASLEINL
jgi:hypothetical protein